MWETEKRVRIYQHTPPQSTGWPCNLLYFTSLPHLISPQVGSVRIRTNSHWIFSKGVALESPIIPRKEGHTSCQSGSSSIWTVQEQLRGRQSQLLGFSLAQAPKEKSLWWPGCGFPAFSLQGPSPLGQVGYWQKGLISGTQLETQQEKRILSIPLKLPLNQK